VSRFTAAVNWRRTFVELARSSSASSLGFAALAGLDDEDLIDPTRVLAQLLHIGIVDPGPVRDAVAAGATGLDDDEVTAVASWAVTTAVDAGRWFSAVDRAPDAPGVAQRPNRAGLRIDPDLAAVALPLRALAFDIARVRGGLDVITAALPAGEPGAFFDVRASRIVLDLDRFQRRRPLVAVWAHEVAHALDPRLELVSAADQERYAVEGGRRLLAADPEPTTVATARLLLADLDAARHVVVRVNDLPAPGAASLVTFLALLAGHPEPSLGHGRPAGHHGGDSSALAHVAGEGRPAGDTTMTTQRKAATS
jgi:hypothetical protein